MAIAMKHKTMLHTTTNAISCPFVGFRKISLCGRKIDRCRYATKGKPRKIAANVHHSPIVMRANLHGDSVAVNARGYVGASRALGAEINPHSQRVGFAWGAGRGVR